MTNQPPLLTTDGTQNPLTVPSNLYHTPFKDSNTTIRQQLHNNNNNTNDSHNTMRKPHQPRQPQQPRQFTTHSGFNARRERSHGRETTPRRRGRARGRGCWQTTPDTTTPQQFATPRIQPPQTTTTTTTTTTTMFDASCFSVSY